MRSFLVLPLLIILIWTESTRGSCHLRALSNTITGRNEGRIPETSQQIQLQLQCDDQTCLMSDYYNTSCGNDTALAQTLGSDGVHLCEKSCITNDQKVAASLSLRITTKVVKVTSTMCPTMSPSLGTPTPAIIPAITSCSPCIKTASNIISTTTETHVERVHITITLLVQAPCTPTPPLFNTKHSGMPSNPKSCNNSNFTTTVVPTACNNSNFTTTVMPTAATHPAATSTYDSTTPLALGALIGLLTVLLLTLTTGWVCTCWIINRKKQAEIRTQNTSIAPSCVNINVTTTLNLNNNPAYEPQTPLQKNLAYEDTTLNISKPEEFQALSNTPEPTYEIIPLTSSQPASTTTHMFGSRKEDEYDKLNRDIAQHTQRNIISQ